MKSTSDGVAMSRAELRVSSFAQSVAFDLVINGKLPDVDFVDVFAHGDPAAVSERRQAVFIDVKHNRLYAAIWHAGLDQEIILTSPVGSLPSDGRCSVLFSVSTILGAYSLFVDDEPVSEIIEEPGNIAGGPLVSADRYHLLRDPGLWIENFRAFPQYLRASQLPRLSDANASELVEDNSEPSFSCIDLERQINLSWSPHADMTFCCFAHNKRGVDVGFLPVTGARIKDSKLPLDHIAAERERIKDIINQGEKETVCHGCPRLQRDTWPSNRQNQLITLTVNSWTACNLRCEYCYTIDPTVPFRATPPYDLMTMFRDLVARRTLAPGAAVGWGGGDVTVLVGFEEASTFLTECGIAQLVNTNAITFSPAIAKGLASGLMDVQVSVDAGTRELYQAIKGRDHLGSVWANLERYHRISLGIEHSTTRMPYPVIVKYIIYHNNCDERELQEFMRRCRQHGMRYVIISAKQGELLPNGRNADLRLEPTPDDEERILRGTALLRHSASMSQVRTSLWTFSPAQERRIQSYEDELVGAEFPSS
jgi:molybdenum cofactor biosynthesis enzyme MoaA